MRRLFEIPMPVLFAAAALCVLAAVAAPTLFALFGGRLGRRP
jgi:hypothetical protein